MRQMFFMVQIEHDAYTWRAVASDLATQEEADRIAMEQHALGESARVVPYWVQ